MNETLTARLLDALAARGATEVFGIPGDFALPLFRAIERSARLPLVTLSHEPGVGFAADAASRARGGLGVAAVTYGAGAFNLVNTVAGAYAERVPLVVLSGAPAAHEAASGLLLHHQVKTLDSQWRLYEELTVDRAVLDDVQTAPARIARVLDAALAHSRPVYLEIPRDMPDRPCDAVPATPAAPVDAERLAACADELLARLRAAQRPMLVVGVEVRRYALESRVAELARRLAIPVATTFMGRGLLADADVALAGTYLGLAGDPALSERVESSDALLLLGVIVSDTNFAVSARRIDFRHAIHAYDGDVAMGHHVYHDLPLAALIDALLERVPPSAAPPPRRGTPPSAPPAAPGGADAPVVPRDIADAINALMRRHGPLPLACDVGDCLFTAMDIEPTALVAPGYYATMGYGVPAGLGLQAATGRRPLVLVGDGAFQMTGWELGNARRYGWDPIVLVFNNASWEMLRTFMPEGRFNDLGTWDFAAMAAGMGGDGHVVTTRGELVAALERAHATRGRFQLLDVRLAPGVLSPTLERFVKAVKRLSMPG
ncbi:indolepyruvate/phenylpyruvate decarboxylase [Azohydromonas sp.]|uniref:indolepyruvate/phenylpyruvate decarboxylase n=1 Tax=Azohydromonas sp. TaxID=1872666 RepID=UPI002C38518D|nr:indolepyruvate/phenylpyruvate decarboxylase [Azohydromonas sp.]HMM86524.1 indolepyruvate/phenylpyruvate decarboxylase [Azohydromonas sp.]